MDRFEAKRKVLAGIRDYARAHEGNLLKEKYRPKPAPAADPVAEPVEEDVDLESLDLDSLIGD